MRMNYLKRWIVLLCCVALLLCGCSGENPIYELFESPQEKALDASRPEGATDLPDFSGEITDVRITTVERETGITTNYGADYGADLSKLTYLQIYYGYCSDGVWKDIPCENYDLVSIFNPVDYHSGELKVTRGYDAVQDDHMVKIGPYLLISVYAKVGKDTLLTIEDSIDSEIQLMFEEYDQWCTLDGIASYAHLMENRDSILSGWKLKWQAVSNVRCRYFVLLKYDEIPEDYQLWTMINPDDEYAQDLLEYADIQYLLGETD